MPADERPPANTMLHWSFDTMVGIGTALIALGAWFGVRLVAKHATSRRRRGSCAPSRSPGIAAIVAMECGWIVTEVGRQPWIVQGVMRTEEAVTGASGVWLTFSIVLVLYAALGIATVLILRRMARRWREEGPDAVDTPYEPERGSRRAGGGRPR